MVDSTKRTHNENYVINGYIRIWTSHHMNDFHPTPQKHRCQFIIPKAPLAIILQKAVNKKTYDPNTGEIR